MNAFASIQHRASVAGPLRTAAALLLLLSVAATRADRPSELLKRYDAAVTRAVERALEYLRDHQLPDGSFPGNMPRNTAITSLCGMAFLAQGYTPGTGPYGEVIDRCVDFILENRQKDGMLVSGTRSHGPMYSHTISTLFLSEVSGMVSPERQKKLDAALGRALRIILDAQRVSKSQRHRGGWRYQPTSNDSDISCTGWALMALRSARNNGAAVPAQAVADAMAFVLRCRNSDGGFAYQPGGDSGMARTGTALLCLELGGRHNSPECRAAGDWILKHLPINSNDRFFYYGLYYTSQGMFQLGGAYWEQFALWMFDAVLKMQKPDGSWPEGKSNEQRAGPCYSTAMAVLALSVVQRQLPIYQR